LTPYWLVFPEYDVKNRIRLEFPLDENVTALIDDYVQNFRLTLLRGSRDDWLFPGKIREQKNAHCVSQQITQRIEKATGLRITVHQFRHAAGAVYLRDHPGDYVFVQQLLGHHSVQTTMRFYIGLATTMASQRWGKIIRNRINKTTEDGDDD
jgi:integrase